METSPWSTLTAPGDTGGAETLREGSLFTGWRPQPPVVTEGLKPGTLAEQEALACPLPDSR